MQAQNTATETTCNHGVCKRRLSPKYAGFSGQLLPERLERFGTVQLCIFPGGYRSTLYRKMYNVQDYKFLQNLVQKDRFIPFYPVLSRF